MPRDSSGNYTKPLPSVATGQTIEASYENTTTDDQSAEFTDSLSRSGKGGMSAPLRNVDGTVTAPSSTFGNEPNSGIYRSSAGDVRYAVLGQDVIRIRTASVQVWDGLQWDEVIVNGSEASLARVLVEDGTAALPSISFSSGPTYGLRYAAGAIYIVINGIDVVKIDSTGITTNQDLKAFTAL